MFADNIILTGKQFAKTLDDFGKNSLYKLMRGDYGV